MRNEVRIVHDARVVIVVDSIAILIHFTSSCNYNNDEKKLRNAHDLAP